jgi:hypothetical protein
LERSLAAAQEEIAKLKSKCVSFECDLISLGYASISISISIVIFSYCHINDSVSVLKDREERYRLHLNRQFETLSDAKNIEEQV